SVRGPDVDDRSRLCRIDLRPIRSGEVQAPMHSATARPELGRYLVRTRTHRPISSHADPWLVRGVDRISQARHRSRSRDVTRHQGVFMAAFFGAAFLAAAFLATFFAGVFLAAVFFAATFFAATFFAGPPDGPGCVRLATVVRSSSSCLCKSVANLPISTR